MLSLAQARIGLLQLYYHDKPIYNMSFDMIITGILDLTLFNKSINYLLIRYQELKINIFLEHDNLCKRYNNNSFSTEVYLGSDLELNESNFINTPFDLSKDLLFKVLYLKQNNKLIFIFSDLIIDGFTILIFFKEIQYIYNCLFDSNIPNFNHIKPYSKNLNVNNLLFWQNHLFISNKFNFKVKQSINNFDENRIHFTIIDNDLDYIKNNLNNATLFDYFTSTFLLLLYIVTDENEITIDTLFGDYTEKNIGLFNDIILLPCKFKNTDISINEFRKDYSKFLLNIKENRISLEYLCNKLNLKDLPNIRIHFEYSNKNTEKEFKFGNATLKSNLYENSSNQIRQLLTLNICEFRNKIECYFSYKDKCFDFDYIMQLQNIFVDLLTNSDEIVSQIKNKYDIKNYYTVIYKEKIDKRLLSYSYAGKYPNIKFSEFKKILDKTS